MRIPEVRDRLRELADVHGIPELDELANELKRRPPVRKAPSRANALTDEIRTAIMAYARSHPRATYTDIGHRFGVGIGRVSETLAGYRE